MAIQSVTIFANSPVVIPVWEDITISSKALPPPASAFFVSRVENGGEEVFVLLFGMLGGGKCLDAVEDEERLEIHRLLGPQRAVVVEDGDAFGGRNEIRVSRSGELIVWNAINRRRPCP